MFDAVVKNIQDISWIKEWKNSNSNCSQLQDSPNAVDLSPAMLEIT